MTPAQASALINRAIKEKPLPQDGEMNGGRQMPLFGDDSDDTEGQTK